MVTSLPLEGHYTYSLGFFYTLALQWVMGPEFVSGKICGGGTNRYAYNFQDFLESPQLKTFPFQSY